MLFLKGDLSRELRSATDPLPRAPHSLHLLPAHCPATQLSLDELNQPMHDLCTDAGAGGEAEEAEREMSSLRTRLPRGRGALWLGDMELYNEMDSDDGSQTRDLRRRSGRFVSWQHRLQWVRAQRMARSRSARPAAAAAAPSDCEAAEAAGAAAPARAGGCGGDGECAARRSARLRGKHAERESAQAGPVGAVAGAAECDGAGGDKAGHVIPPHPNIACMLHSRECGHDGTTPPIISAFRLFGMHGQKEPGFTQSPSLTRIGTDSACRSLLTTCRRRAMTHPEP